MASPVVLFAAGGDVLSKYGTLLWRKGLATRGGEIPYTFTRTGNGLYLTNDVSAGGLVVRTASGGNVRVEQLVDPVTGVLQSYLKLEAGATNSLLQSQAWATAPWTTNLLTATNNAGTAPDSTTTASKLVPTAVSSGDHACRQNIATITAGEYVAVSGFFSASGYTGFRLAVAGASGTFQAAVDLTAGTIVASGNVGSYAIAAQAIIALGGGIFWVGVWGKTATDTATQYYVQVYDTGPHAVSSTAFTGDATSGILAWGGQFERNGTTPTVAPPPTSYVATGVGTAARNPETFQVPYFFGPNAAPRWIYVRWLPRGEWAAGSAQFPAALTIGSFTAPNWRTQIYNDRGLGQYSGTDGNSSAGQAISTTPMSPSFGQALEALLLTTVGGVNVLRLSLNGAADVVGGTSGAKTLPADYGVRLLSPGDNSAYPVSNFLFSRLLVGTGAVSQIADVRNIL